MKITLSCPIHDSFRVQQVAGMFDVPLGERLTETFRVELPADDEPWQIGLIVGPSGSGKTSVARQTFGEQLYQGCDWPGDRAVIDCFDHLPVRKATELLTAVGFSSPPSWIKPYHVLSNGERFRCDLAMALSQVEKPGFSTEACRSRGSEAGSAKSTRPEAGLLGRTTAFDEFTSVVDRNVARVCSAAVARAVRKGRVHCRFVAVTCHYDVAEWLEPDWVLDMATGELQRRRLRRPAIELHLHRTTPAAWPRFARHHYLSRALHKQAQCYLATWRGEPVFFAATLPMVGRRNHRRFTRIVTLPDYQGVGIGTRSMAAVAELHCERGLRISVTSSHPALIQHCRRSPLWRATRVTKAGRSHGRSRLYHNYQSATGRAVVSFEYVGADRC